MPPENSRLPADQFRGPYFTVVQCSIPLMAIKPFVEAMVATSEVTPPYLIMGIYVTFT
nr:hypothetical protein Iba_chr14bCG5260 [Ipomoea batatas]GME13676.1 hypothetical protein Iba_scaffold14590CG0020 [Ipomoea batatas]GME15101.1 hypothetical protein Iba_scaffold15878CG0050 [Ipomoea batatas]